MKNKDFCYSLKLPCDYANKTYYAKTKHLYFTVMFMALDWEINAVSSSSTHLIICEYQ